MPLAVPTGHRAADGFLGPPGFSRIPLGTAPGPDCSAPYISLGQGPCFHAGQASFIHSFIRSSNKNAPNADSVPGTLDRGQGYRPCPGARHSESPAHSEQATAAWCAESCGEMLKLLWEPGAENLAQGWEPCSAIMEVSLEALTPELCLRGCYLNLSIFV